MSSLLPPSATPALRHVEAATARLADVDAGALRRLWDPDACPVTLLPWLAWALSVDEWDPSWPEDRKREVIRSAFAVHRVKGTLAAIRQALTAAGYGDATVLEGAAQGAGFHWATYRLTLARPVTIAQGERVRAMLADLAPARCRLEGLDYQQALNTYDGTIAYDGTWSYGVA